MYKIDLHMIKSEESDSSPLLAWEKAIQTVSPFSADEQNTALPCIVALGAFDGVHLGHIALIRKAVAYAAEHHIDAAVWSFCDDISALPNKNGGQLTSLSERLRLFASFGVDTVYLSDFSKIRKYSPEEFAAFLKKDCHAVAAVCGYNFSFGVNRAGNSDLLQKLMSPYDCIVLSPVTVDGITVSSSEIRHALENGDAELAARLLGRPYEICLPVVHGKELGRTIGLPTVNQNFPTGYIIPKGGIYAVTVTVDGRTYPAVSNIGSRPTVESNGRINCETHIIGYHGWLYGRYVTVAIRKRLRDEQKFDSIDALTAQIHRDIDNALAYFQNDTKQS